VNFLDVIIFQWYVSWRLYSLVVKGWEDVHSKKQLTPDNYSEIISVCSDICVNTQTHYLDKMHGYLMLNLVVYQVTAGL